MSTTHAGARVALQLLGIAWLAPTLGAQGRPRAEVERSLTPLEAAYRAAPGDPAARRPYAATLFQLGDVWRANDVIAPLAMPWSSDVADLTLGARLALLTGDYPRAEALYSRVMTLAGSDSARQAAVDGLTLVYYQSNRYDEAKALPTPAGGEERGLRSLLTFMQRFEGRPYRIEWATPEHVAQLPIVNDFTRPGALPTMRLEVNGRVVTFILDTGGDRLYLDAGVAKELGIRVVATRKSRYAYTQGRWVDEPLGVADQVRLGEVTLRNVPVIVAQWKSLGQTTDGVLTTQILKQFLSTVDYAHTRLTFRERSDQGRRRLIETFGTQPPVRIPFFMTGTHLMFAKGSLNGHQDLNLLLDSGLAMSAPLVILDETVEYLGLPKTPLPNTRFYRSPVETFGLGPLTRGPDQAIGNVMVEENVNWQHGFLFDALISHQYLWHLGSWTIDFDTMSYWFPARGPAGG